MNRWLAAVGLAATTTVAMAQAPVNNKPGYLIIRIKLSDAGGTAAPGGGAGGGGDIGGKGYGQGGYGPGMYGGNQGGRPGGPGGGLAGGGLGGPGLPGGFGGVDGGGTDPESLAKERSIAVLVPYNKMLPQHLLYKNKGYNQEKNPRLPYIEHAYGATYLYQDGTSVQIKQDELTNQESEIRAKHKKWSASPNRKSDELMLYVEQAFAADLPKLATEYADDLLKMKDASGQTGEFIKAYTELKARLGNALPSDPAAQGWRTKLGGTATISDDAPHYTLIHFGAGQNLSQDALTRKADLLEENFRTFYTWHALKSGKLLPFPDKKLIVVVAKKGGELAELRGRLDGMKTGEDSFYSQEHNLLVLSPERTDDLGRSFFESARSKSTREGFDRSDLLKGNAPPLRDKLTATDVALASTYALVERMLEVEADKAAITSEGTRQLYAAAGLLPKYVRLSLWMEAGIASVLQHPKSMGVVELAPNKPGLALGTKPGYGAPNNLLLREFQAFYPASRRKEIKTEEVLRNTILDRYFEAVATATDLDGVAPAMPATGGNNPGRPGGNNPGGGAAPPPGIRGPGRRGSENDAQNPPPPPPPPGGGAPGGAPGGVGGVAGAGTGSGSSGIYDSSREHPPLTQAQLHTKAKATAWALIFFMSQKKAVQYHAFLQELNSLPRDLRIDKQVILRRYCRTFDLLDQDGETINEAAFKAHADEWFDFINGQSPSWREVTLAFMNGTNSPTGGRPGGPGGLPGPGGPGGGLPGPGSPDGGN